MRLCLVLLLAAAAAHAQDRSFDALDAVVRGDRVIAVSGDGRELRATSIETGALVWHVPLGEGTQAAIIHALRSDRVLVQAASRYVAVDLRGGRVLYRGQAPASWHFVQQAGGACLLAGECQVEPISCDDGHALGPRWSGAWIEYHDMDGSASTSCAAFFDPIGRAGDLFLYAVGPLVDGPAGRELIAIDSSGAVRWRSPALASQTLTWMGSGVSSDGRTCWATDSGEHEWTLRGFECATGQVLFTRALPRRGPHHMVPMLTGWAEPGGIFVTTRDAAMLLARDGREIWRREGLAPDVLLVPAGLRVADFVTTIADYHTLEHVGVDGTQQQIEAIADRELRVVDGSLVLMPPGAASTRGGGLVPPPQVFRFFRDRAGSRAELAGQPVLSVAGDAWLAGEHRSGRGAWLIVVEPRQGQPDRVHVLHVRP